MQTTLQTRAYLSVSATQAFDAFGALADSPGLKSPFALLMLDSW